MTTTKYGSLVESAKQRRLNRNKFVLDTALESLSALQNDLSIWARELHIANQHITIKQDQIDAAAEAYEQIANHLVSELKWERKDINIHPQGSSRTKTLIRSPDASKFDIDAVCQVDISRIDARDPMSFFEEVGQALSKFKPGAKKRCWRIEFPDCRFYIEFTPSVPLSTIPGNVLDSVRYKPANNYGSTALAVVDRPTEYWKTSNPEGFANWVNEQAEKKLLLNLALESAALSMDFGIAPVPSQEVPLSDTLRVAIRLFKRHRDMAVQKGNLDSEYKPISVIIVTLLTQCYEGLADIGDTYSHPIQLLTDLAELLPGMIEERDGEYWIANPTVEGENFAERWNQDEGERKTAFDNWCDLLIDDLQSILKETHERAIQERVRQVFGCTGADTSGPKPSSGLAPSAPTHVVLPPATPGLA
jgi:hypothetical protein